MTTALLEPAAVTGGVLVVGTATCERTHRLCDWLTRNGQAFDFVQAGEHQPEFRLPILAVGQDNELRFAATPNDAAELLGYARNATESCYDLVVVGAGPAGLSAAIHAAAEGLKCLVVEAYAIGGQASSSQRVENYAGADAVNGRELTLRMYQQAKRLGAEFLLAKRVTNVGERCVTLDDGVTINAKAIVLATGAAFRVLPSCDTEWTHRGVYYGMTDADVQQCGLRVVVVGAGNSAGQAALAFASVGKQVTLLVRGSGLTQSMSAYLVKQLAAEPRVDVWFSSEIQQTIGEKRLNALRVKRDEHEILVPCDAVFVFAGSEPNSAWLPSNVARDAKGFVDAQTFQTSQPGVYAIGDVRSGSTKRISVAAAEGAAVVAALWPIIHQENTNNAASRQRVG